MAFIPVDKMRKLRESAKGGDERAKKILMLQMGGEDFSSLMDEFFAPQPEPTQTVETQSMPQKTKLEEFLEFNNVSKDSPDYDSFVEDFYREFPNEREHPTIHEVEHEEDFEEWIKKLMGEESDAIDSYSKVITKVMNCEMLDDSKKRRVIARLKEIRGDEEEHFRELSELLKGNSDEIDQKEEKLEGIVE